VRCRNLWLNRACKCCLPLRLRAVDDDDAAAAGVDGRQRATLSHTARHDSSVHRRRLWWQVQETWWRYWCLAQCRCAASWGPCLVLLACAVCGVIRGREAGGQEAQGERLTTRQTEPPQKICASRHACAPV